MKVIADEIVIKYCQNCPNWYKDGGHKACTTCPHNKKGK